MYISNIGSREKMEEYFNKTSSQIRETLRENAREGLKVQKMFKGRETLKNLRYASGELSDIYSFHSAKIRNSALVWSPWA